jgi:hypothetical protein
VVVLENAVYIGSGEGHGGGMSQSELRSEGRKVRANRRTPSRVTERATGSWVRVAEK